LNADGVALSSSYGIGADASEHATFPTVRLTHGPVEFIGHDCYDPIWADLNRRNAVVFVHGSQTPSSTPYPHPTLGLPVSEVPNETYKAAAHLVVTGRKRKYPDVKIVLAHMGGNTINLSTRVAALSHYMGASLTPDEIMEDFKTFYFDTALSASEVNLTAVENFVGVDRLLFGTDLPGD
jgi:6-methylsalicylate decarboxylase